MNLNLRLRWFVKISRSAAHHWISIRLIILHTSSTLRKCSWHGIAKLIIDIRLIPVELCVSSRGQWWRRLLSWTVVGKTAEATGRSVPWCWLECHLILTSLVGHWGLRSRLLLEAGLRLKLLNGDVTCVLI
jgi:hypothetical protein